MIAAALLVCLWPTATDGDTFRCGMSNVSIRLFGINSVDGSSLDDKAKAALDLLVEGGVTCEPKGTSFSRIVAICTNVAGQDVGKWIIDHQLASEWCAYSRNYYGTCAALRPSPR